MLLSTTHSLTNASAIQLIKQLFAPKYKKLNEKVVKDALEIYNRIQGNKNCLVINTLSRLYLHYNYPQNIILIWNDIELANNDVDRIEYDILIQCCSKINDKFLFDMNKSIQLLEWIKQNNYYNNNLTTQKLKNYSIFICKLLINCKTLNKFQYIHSLINDINTNNENIFIKTTLMNGYNNFGLVDIAFNIFDSIKYCDKDCVCINEMMKGLLNNGYPSKALVLYDKYCNNKYTQNNHIFHMLALKCCMKLNDFEKGKQIHTLNIKPSIGNNIILATTLIDFYAFFEDYMTAEKIFNGINNKRKDKVIVTSIMKCLINNELNEKALELYDNYKQFHDTILHSFAIKACINTNNFERGKSIIINQGNDLMNCTVIEFYGYFGYIEDAINTFNSIQSEKRDIFCIGAIMKALINNNKSKYALDIYETFKHLMDDRSHVLALKACTNLNEFETGQTIINSHFNKPSNYSIEVMTTIIDFYGNFGDTITANNIFQSINDKHKNIACINAMMNAFCDKQLTKECIELFNDIKTHKYFQPNNLSYTIALKACTQSTLLHIGLDIHKHLIENNKHLLTDLGIQICLIGMYGKCGQLDTCKNIFDEIKKNDFKRYESEIRIWNALIHAYGRNGDIKDAMKTYYIMTDGIGLLPNDKTFIVLFNSCSHSGEIAIARNLWQNEMNCNENMKINVIATYIDCISRNELYLNEAYELVLKYDTITKQNKENDNKMMWMSLLNGCTKYKKIELSQIIYNEIEKRYGNTKKYNDYMSAASQLLSNMYT